MKKGWFGVHFQCVSNTWRTFQSEKCKIERGIAYKPFFFVITRFIYGIEFLEISLDGWRIGQWNLYPCFPCVFSIVSTNFHLVRKRRFFYELSVGKLVFLSFRRYLGETESGEKKKSMNFEFSRISRRDRGGGKKKLEFFTNFFGGGCSVVSGSVIPIFQVLIR